MRILKSTMIVSILLAMITPAAVLAQTGADDVRVPFIGWRDGHFIDETIDPVREPANPSSSTGHGHATGHRHPGHHPSAH